MGGLDGGPVVTFGATFGVVTPITPRVGAGAVVMLVVGDDPFLAVAPRIRLHTSPNTAVDLSPGLIVAGDDEDIGRLWLDAGWMYKDRIGVGVQVGWVDQLTITDEYYQYQVVAKRPVVRTGLRLGSKPGGTGVIVQAAVVVGIVVACIAGDGCGGFR